MKLSGYSGCIELTMNISAFVGLAVMILLAPVPARVASLMGGVQKEKMKAVSCSTFFL